MLPSDGDAWTENDNSTYPWRFQSPYFDTFSWETDAQNGTYSLRVNHTSTYTYLAFYLDIGSLQDISSYDMLFLRFKITGGNGFNNLQVYLSDTGAFAGNQYKINVGDPDEGIWLSFVIPWHSWTVFSGSPSLTSVRYIVIYVSGVGSADGTKIYIDAMRLQNFSISSPLKDDLFLPNFYGLFPQYVDKRVFYAGKSYTSVWDFINTTTGAPQGSQYLEGEALGQDIFALSIAYNATKSPYIFNKLKNYVEWLLVLQEDTYGAVRRFYSNSSGVFNNLADTLYNGWCLAGLSYYYALTENATVKAMADSMRSFLVDKMWNVSKNSFNVAFNVTAGKVSTYWTSDDEMRDGGADVGLALYHRLISTNSTVKSVVDANLNKYLLKKSASYNFTFAGTAFESRSYLRWGFYEASKAFSNNTYKVFAGYSPELVAQNLYLNGNASALWNFRIFQDSSTSNHLDGWGLANNLLLNIHIYEDTGEIYVKNMTERNIWQWFDSVKTSIWATPRYKNSGTQEDSRAWCPTNLFIYATLAKLYFEVYQPSNPYAILVTHKITSSYYADNKLNITIDVPKGKASTTEIYTCDKGKPRTVFGAKSWSYDNEAKILTLNLLDSGLQEIFLDWTTDRVPPTTTISLSGIQGNSGWFTSEVIVTLNATDNFSGVNKTEYSFDNVTRIDYTTPLIISAEGYTILSYNSIDNDGNIETIKSETIKIDETAPSGSIIINNGNAYTNSTSATLTLNATDTISGVAQMRFSIGFGTWTPWEAYSTSKSWTLPLEDGAKVIYVQFMDNAGLISTYSETIILDMLPPTIYHTYPSQGNEIKSSTVTVTWRASDRTSGISHYEIRLDNGSWIDTAMNSTHTFTGLSDGTHTVEVKATDKAGNAEQVFIRFTINTTLLFGSGYIEEAAIAVAIIIFALAIALYVKKIRKR